MLFVQLIIVETIRYTRISISNISLMFNHIHSVVLNEESNTYNANNINKVHYIICTKEH